VKPPPEVYREEVNLPFVFALNENMVNASHSVSFSLKCHNVHSSSSVKLAWGMHANCLQDFLKSSWETFEHSFWDLEAIEEVVDDEHPYLCIQDVVL